MTLPKLTMSELGRSRVLRLMLVLAFLMATMMPRPDDSGPRWVVNGVERVQEGLRFARPGMAATGESPQWVRDAIASDTLILNMVVESAAAVQDGPARILTLSINPHERNLTIGQQGTDLVIRVRRDESTLNGTPPYVIPGVFATDGARSLRLALVDDVLVAELDGEERLRAQLPAQALAHWDPSYPLALGNELTWDRPWLGTISRAELTTPSGTVDLLESDAVRVPPGGPVNLSLNWVSRNPVDLLLNFLLMIPIGFLWARTSDGAGILGVALLWLPIVVAVEAAQLVIPGRFASASDVLLNVLGVMVGAWLAGRRVGGVFALERSPDRDS